MNNEILVSVIVTCYNVEDFIAQTISALLEQTHGNLEIIIIDDASTDNTVAIAKSVISNDSRFHIIELETNTPGGAGPPSNIGIKKAKGDYLTFLDGDDYLSTNTIKRLVYEAVQQNADITISNYKNVETSTNKLLPPPDAGRWGRALEYYRAESTEDLRKDILRFNSVPWRKLYLTEFVRKNNLLFPEGDFFYEDNPLHWRSTLLAGKFALVPQDLFFHRVEREGQTTTGNEKALFKMFLHHETIFKDLKAEKKESFTPYLLCWLTSQIMWISERTSDKNLDELFGLIRPCMLRHDVSDIVAALKIGDYPRRVYCLWTALRKNDGQVFRTWVRGGGMPRSIPYRLMYFIRKDGLIALITRKHHEGKGSIGRAPEYVKQLENRLQNIEKKLNQEAIKSEKKLAALFLLLGEISESNETDCERIKAQQHRDMQPNHALKELQNSKNELQNSEGGMVHYGAQHKAGPKVRSKKGKSSNHDIS